MIAINYRDPRPIYEQVKFGVRRLIMTQVLQPHDKMPSVRELSAQLAINPNTVQRAYASLEEKGVIVSVKGRGSFVAPDLSAIDRVHEKMIDAMMREVILKASLAGWDKERIERKFNQILQEEVTKK